MKIFDLIFLIHGWNKGSPRDKDYRSYNHGRYRDFSETLNYLLRQVFVIKIVP